MDESTARELLGKGEKVVSQGPATDGAINEFHTMMQGESYQEGGRFDANDRGVGSGINSPQVPGNYEEAEPRPEEALYAQDAESQEGEGYQDWKKMYGDSENEKGEWRRTAQEAMQQLEQMKAELGSMRAAFAQAPQQAQYQPPQAPYYAPPQQLPYNVPQQAQPQFPDTYFPDKGEGDFLEPRDVDNVLQRVDAYMQGLQQQGLQLYMQQLQLMKTSAGIDQATEQRIAGTYPWIAQMPEGPAKIQAIQQMVNAEKAKTPASRQPKPTQARVSPEQAAARRVTYIENNRQKSHTEAEVPLQQRIAQEFTAAKTAFEKRKVLEKYGMRTANDWGPDVYTR